MSFDHFPDIEKEIERLCDKYAIDKPANGELASRWVPKVINLLKHMERKIELLDGWE